MHRCWRNLLRLKCDAQHRFATENTGISSFSDSLRKPRFPQRLWSAKTLSRAGQREGIIMMKPAKDWYGSDGIRLSAAIVRIGNRVHEGTDGRIRDTGTQGHMWTRPIVMGNPPFQNRP